MTSTEVHVLALRGDGIGPEVVNAGPKVLDIVASCNGLTIYIEGDLLHGAAYERHGTSCRDETVAAVLVGAVGGPQWDPAFPGGTPAQKDGLTRLRQELDVYAGLRPADAHDGLLGRTPYKKQLVTGATTEQVTDAVIKAYREI